MTSHQEQFLKQQAAYDCERANRTASTGVAQAWSNQGRQLPEPSLLNCARELYGYLSELGATLDELRGRTFSPEACGQCGTASPPDDSLEATLRRSSKLAASLVGEARTINAKLLG